MLHAEILTAYCSPTTLVIGSTAGYKEARTHTTLVITVSTGSMIVQEAI